MNRRDRRAGDHVIDVGPHPVDTRSAASVERAIRIGWKLRRGRTRRGFRYER